MPARVRKVGDKFRVVEPDGTLILKGDSAVDGGGHATRAQAMAQAQAINLNRTGPKASGRRRRKRFDKGQDLA